MPRLTSFAVPSHTVLAVASPPIEQQGQHLDSSPLPTHQKSPVLLIGPPGDALRYSTDLNSPARHLPSKLLIAMPAAPLKAMSILSSAAMWLLRPSPIQMRNPFPTLLCAHSTLVPASTLLLPRMPVFLVRDYPPLWLLLNCILLKTTKLSPASRRPNLTLPGLTKHS